MVAVPVHGGDVGRAFQVYLWAGAGFLMRGWLLPLLFLLPVSALADTAADEGFPDQLASDQPVGGRAHGDD